MIDWDRYDAILKHVWLEPRGCAEMDWFHEYGGVSQLMAQIPRAEAKQFVAGGGWAIPDRKIQIVFHEPPDWDWWEPTSQWRRIDAREREWQERSKPSTEPERSSDGGSR